MFYSLCRDFKLIKFTGFFPPLDLVKFYTSLPFPPFETKGHTRSADLRYEEEDSVSPRRLFLCHKEPTHDIYSPYPPLCTQEVSSEMKLK